MSDELEERLRNHARSFDSLLSLIPAKLYYGEDVSDQWNRKKQTPEQKRAAKMAKLDRDNWKSAKDVLDERAAVAKRKREDGESSEVDGAVKTEPPKSIQDQEHPKAKKRKADDSSQPNQPQPPSSIEEKKQRKAEKKAAQREKAQKEKEKAQRQKARKQAEKAQDFRTTADDVEMAEPIALSQEPKNNDQDMDQWSTASSSEGVPDVLSPPGESGSSSISSLPPSIPDQPIKPQSSKSKQRPKPQPNASQPSTQTFSSQSLAEREAAKERLANAISSFRSARKADESSLKRPRNRAELLEQRRQKEEAKRLAKKEQRKKEREEAARKEDDEIARRFSPGGSGSLLASPRSPPSKDGDAGSNNFSYGRIEFGDGTKIDPSNPANLLGQQKRKGPQDTQTALNAAKNKASRLAGLDEDKRKSIEEKDMWLSAKRRAHGERVKDDTSLLKKALKRQESQKKKSEKEWTERKEGIAKSQGAKQKKRTDNLAKRRDEKMSKKTGVKKGSKVKKRPGFEGSFRGRTGGANKKS